MGKAASKLSNEDLNELKKSTKFQTKELKQWYKGFKRDCPSGKLTREEFIRIHKQFFPFGDPTDFSNYAFDAFDKDKSDAIDFKEFIIALSIASRGTKEEKLRWTFNMYDLDRDGIISYDEMLLIVKAIYKMIGPMVELSDDEASPDLRVQKIFRLMQKQPDEKISLDEFTAGSKTDPNIVMSLELYSGLV